MDFLAYFERYLQGNGWQTRRVDASPLAPAHLIAFQTDKHIAVRLIDNPEIEITPEMIRATSEESAMLGCAAGAIVARQQLPRNARREADRLSPMVVLIGIDDIGTTAKIFDAVISGTTTRASRARKAQPKAKSKKMRFAAIVLIIALISAAALVLRQPNPPIAIESAITTPISVEAPDDFDPDATAQPLTPEASERLRARLAQIQIGVLPDAQSYAHAWLARQNLRLSPITWEALAAGSIDPSKFPILLYATSEHYVQTVRSERDVDFALHAYLNSGGMLVVLPYMPYPFYYNEKNGRPMGQVLNEKGRFGIRFSQHTWERLPAGPRFEFHTSRSRMPHLPGRLPFPAEGDQRWRPISAAPGEATARYETLLRLVDENERPYADGAGYVRSNHGRILYGWFRLLDSQHRDAYLHDLFSFAADELSLP